MGEGVGGCGGEDKVLRQRFHSGQGQLFGVIGNRVGKGQR